MVRRVFTKQRRGALRAVATLAVALLGGVIARLLILALVSVSAFPGIEVHYCAPAYALMITAVALVLIAESSAELSRDAQADESTASTTP
jgi:hypothetical protein